ncbi:5-carboxymethyl-2-hydroxymuconate isomerase [Kitasatospora gansuensis]|uniref:5-carboxymethyl-2-hydroxymuconate isomerase n=1 Tax=Kitasatospora gansuensis TaxID=258050 RepID=A0A7W7S7H0_9ACTN|nr:isomerase [Kitasatospora gansuensis]MBB4945349.1 5-carboxymethyl-2-hydroxymuconate isomerase [Kitasatospora gansuensis]
MPQILVDYSAELDFDREGFAKELHPVIAEVIDTEVAACKSVFRPAGEYVLGDGASGEVFVLVEIKILAGRSPEQRAELTRRTLALLERYVTVPLAYGVEVTELDRATYRFGHLAAR